MANEAMKAGVRTFVRFLELDFSADTINRLFDILRLILKEQLEERSKALRDRVEAEEITETQALEILDELEAELKTSSTPSLKTT